MSRWKGVSADGAGMQFSELHRRCANFAAIPFRVGSGAVMTAASAIMSSLERGPLENMTAPYAKLCTRSNMVDVNP